MGLLQYPWSLPDVRLVLLSVVLILVLDRLLRRPRSLTAIPGPRAYPLVGSVPAFAWEAWRGKQPYRILQEYRARYGPVFRLRVLNKTVVVLNDFASIREVFTHPDMQDRPYMYFLTDFMGGSGVVSSSGETWLGLRRFSLNIFKGLGVGKSSFEETVASEAEELLKEFSSLGGRPFDPNHLLKNGVSNVICSVLFGRRFRYSDAEFKKLLHYIDRSNELLGTGGALLFFPSLRHLPFFPGAELASIFRELRKFLDGLIDAHRDSFDAACPRDLTDALLSELGTEAAGQAGERAGVGYQDVASVPGSLSDMILAGTETASNALQWCLLYMAVHPDAQRRVQDEIDAVVGRNRLPRMADKSGLNFTRAVIWEVQRLSCVVPMGVAHIAAADAEFKGFAIQKGSVIAANMMALFHDPAVWPDPEEFKPERFLDDEGKVVKREELIPFGIGRRTCIGENLAKMELFLFFTHFLHQFTFKKPDGAPPLTLKGNIGIVNQPTPFEICAIRRD